MNSRTTGTATLPPKIDREAAYADAMHQLAATLANIKSLALEALEDGTTLDPQLLYDLATGRLERVRGTVHGSRAQVTEVTPEVFEQILSAPKLSPVTVRLADADPMTGILAAQGLRRVPGPRCDVLTLEILLADPEEPAKVLEFRPVAPSTQQVQAARDVRRYIDAKGYREINGRDTLDGITGVRPSPVPGEPEVILYTLDLLTLADLADPQAEPVRT